MDLDRRLQDAELEAAGMASPELPEIERVATHSSSASSTDRSAYHREHKESHQPFTGSTAAPAASSPHPTGNPREDLRQRPSWRSGSQRRSSLGLARVDTETDLERHPTELSRIATARSQQNATVGHSTSALSSRASRKPLPPFGAGKPYPPQLPEKEQYVVEFDGPDDPMHAQNWPMSKKLYTAIILGYTTMTSAFASSIFSTATMAIGAQYNVSREVGVLGVTLFVMGFALGPTFWAPLSELKGRRMPIVLSMFGFTVFSIACATAKDIQTILLCRFFSGLFGACPLAVVAAVFSDMFDNRTRGIALALFSMAVFSGPLLAPFIGGYIVESHLGWRWTEYLVTIMGGVALILDFIFLEETYPPVILVEKAAELRRRTKNWGIHARQDEIEVDFRELVSKNFSRPMRLLFGEPIVLLLSIYMSFIYGLLYLFLTAYSYVFVTVYGFNLGQSGMTFFGMIIGQLIAGAVVILQQPWYQRKLAANNGIPVPEWRLPSVIAGGVSFTIGLFWFGWTSYTGKIHWIVPVLSGIFSGFGLMSIFLQSINYLVDSYLMFAASALAGNTFLRSLVGAVFPLFGLQMYEGMHVQWASTLLGCVAAALVPIPIIFYYYGHKIRQRSNYAPTAPAPSAAPISDGHDDEQVVTTTATTTGAAVRGDEESQSLPELSPNEQAALAVAAREDSDALLARTRSNRSSVARSNTMVSSGEHSREKTNL